MKNAKELMLEFTAFSIRDPKNAAEMFAEDGAFEMPYLATFGIPSQYDDYLSGIDYGLVSTCRPGSLPLVYLALQTRQTNLGAVKLNRPHTSPLGLIESQI